MPVPKNIKVQRCKNQDIKQNDANENQHSLFCMHLGNNLLKTEIIHNHSIPYLFFRGHQTTTSIIHIYLTIISGYQTRCHEF